MKKVIEQYGAYFEPLIIISALIIAMLAQSQLNMFFFWIAFTLLLGISLGRLRKPDLYFPLIKDKAFLAYSIFILWGIISCLYWSVVKVNSIFTIFVFLIGLLSYFIGFTENSKQSLYVRKLLLVLGLGLVVYTCYQFFTLNMVRPVGLFLNWNTHAALLGMVILPWILSCSLDPKVHIAQFCLISIITLFFAFAMGLTQSRGALLILAIGFIFVSIILWRQHLFYKKSLILLLVIILGYMLSGFFVSETILQRISHVADLQTYTPTSSGRQLLWLPAWEMYLDRPFFGWGLDAYKALFAEYKAPLTSEWGYYAHNDYLQFLLELGPVGLLLFLAFVFFIIQKLYYVLQSKEGKLSSNEIEACILLIPCIGMLIHTFFTFHLYHLSMQIIFGYYLGKAAKYIQIEQRIWVERTDLKDNKQYEWLYRTACFAVIIFATTSGFSSYHIVKAEKGDGYPEKIDHYLKASLFFPALDGYEALSARHFTRLLQSMPLIEDNIDQRRKIAAYAVEKADEAIKKMPRQKWNYIVKAEVLRNIQGDYAGSPYFCESSFWASKPKFAAKA